jgi:hypothetical protein
MRKLFLLLLLLFTVLSACQRFDEFEEIDSIDYNAEFAIPLVDTRMSIQDILKNFEETSSLTVDPDGLLRFKYKGDVIVKTSDDIFAEINHTLSQFPFIPILSKRQALPFSSPDGLQIDRLELIDGKLSYFFQNAHPESVNVTISFPQVKKNGQPLVFQSTIGGYSGSGDMPFLTNFVAPASLADYVITQENDSIYIEYEAIRATGQPDTLSNFIIRIQDFKFRYAEGYLGNQIHQGGRDTIQIDFFDNWIRGDVYFEDPKISFNFENSFGIPTRSIVNVFDIFTVRSEVLPLESSFVSQGIDFPYPSLDEVGQVKMESFVFTKDNSNIDIVLGAGPLAVDYDVDAITNPDSNTDIRGFITSDSYYKVQVEVELPLYGNAVDFITRDTFDIDFSNYEDVEHAEFKLVADNSMPLSVDIQGYFLDENGVVLDSLLDSRQRLIEAAPVNSEGVVIQEYRKTTYAAFAADRFQRIKGARRILVNAAFSTYNDGAISVKVFSHQDVNIRLGVKLGVRK